jgi:uncharacterized protein YjiS (DUF1127 family)
MLEILARHWTRWKRRRSTERQLRALDTRILADIGIARDQIAECSAPGACDH